MEKREHEKRRLDENGNPVEERSGSSEKDKQDRSDALPEGNGATDKPAAFPPHN